MAILHAMVFGPEDGVSHLVTSDPGEILTFEK